MTQTVLNFNSKLTPQAQRLYERLRISPITNAQIRDELGLLGYTRRLTEIRRWLGTEEIKKTWMGNGIYRYEITERAAISLIENQGGLPDADARNAASPHL